MYCPDCGTKTSPDHKFCRSCGMSLRMISQMLTSHHSKPAGATVEDNSAELVESGLSESRQQRRLRKIVFLAPMLVLLAIVGLGFEVPEASVPIAIIIGIILMRYTGWFKLLAARQTRRVTGALAPELPVSRIPAARYDSMPSVTESTTRTLEPVCRDENLASYDPLSPPRKPPLDHHATG